MIRFLRSLFESEEASLEEISLRYRAGGSADLEHRVELARHRTQPAASTPWHRCESCEVLVRGQHTCALPEPVHEPAKVTKFRGS